MAKRGARIPALPPSARPEVAAANGRKAREELVPEYFKMPFKLAGELVDYLAGRPYRESVGFLERMGEMEPAFDLPPEVGGETE